MLQLLYFANRTSRRGKEFPEKQAYPPQSRFRGLPVLCLPEVSVCFGSLGSSRGKDSSWKSWISLCVTGLFGVPAVSSETLSGGCCRAGTTLKLLAPGGCEVKGHPLLPCLSKTWQHSSLVGEFLCICTNPGTELGLQMWPIITDEVLK